MPAHLTPAQLAHDLAVTDLSDPADGPHAIQQLIGAAVAALTAAWGGEVRWCRGPRVVSVADNYDNLGYPAAAVTREARYTRYVHDERHDPLTARCDPSRRRAGPPSGPD